MDLIKESQEKQLYELETVDAKVKKNIHWKKMTSFLRFKERKALYNFQSIASQRTRSKELHKLLK